MKCCAQTLTGNDCKYKSKIEVEGKHYCCVHKPKEQCPICFENISSKSKITTSCKHVFHSACLERWTRENTTCPMCRAEIILKRPRLVSIFSTVNPTEIPLLEMVTLMEHFTNDFNAQNENGMWVSHLEY